MRIESGQRVAAGGVRGSGRGAAADAGFAVASEPATARAASIESAGPLASLDALLALQAVDDPLLKKRKLVRRGRSLLDGLEALRREVLAGPVGEGRLNHLMALVGQAREQADPGLDALIDDIELRVQVELAKRGRFLAS
jgi:hypothetical protein